MVDWIALGLAVLGAGGIGYSIGARQAKPPSEAHHDQTDAIIERLQPELSALNQTNQSLASRSERVEHLLTGGGGTRKGKFGETLTGYAIRSIIPADMVLEQFSVSSNDASILKPDFVIEIPGWKRIAIESKFTSVNSTYVRNRVKECQKYIGLDGFENFVVMVIPSEGVFIDVYTNCAATVERAASEGVYILSLASLTAFLNCLRQTVRKQEIAEKAEAITESLRGIGRDIQETAEETLASATKLTRGSKQIQNGMNEINEGLTGLNTLKAKIGRLSHDLDKELY